MDEMMYDVELYFGYYLGNAKCWDTYHVSVLAKDSDNAVMRAKNMFSEDPNIIANYEVAFYGLYCVQPAELESI